MPIYLDLANIIIAKSAIIKKYRGGIEAFRDEFITRDAPRNQEDNELFNIVRMNADDFDYSRLMDEGIECELHDHIISSEDFTVITRLGGQLWPVLWLEQNTVFAWHIDCSEAEKAEVARISAMTLDDIESEFEKGNLLLKTIRA